MKKYLGEMKFMAFISWTALVSVLIVTGTILSKIELIPAFTMLILVNFYLLLLKFNLDKTNVSRELLEHLEKLEENIRISAEDVKEVVENKNGETERMLKSKIEKSENNISEKITTFNREVYTALEKVKTSLESSNSEINTKIENNHLILEGCLKSSRKDLTDKINVASSELRSEGTALKESLKNENCKVIKQLEIVKDEVKSGSTSTKNIFLEKCSILEEELSLKIKTLWSVLAGALEEVSNEVNEKLDKNFQKIEFTEGVLRDKIVSSEKKIGERVTAVSRSLESKIIDENKRAADRVEANLKTIEYEAELNSASIRNTVHEKYALLEGGLNLKLEVASDELRKKLEGIINEVNEGLDKNSQKMELVEGSLSDKIMSSEKRGRDRIGEAVSVLERKITDENKKVRNDLIDREKELAAKVSKNIEVFENRISKVNDTVESFKFSINTINNTIKEYDRNYREKLKQSNSSIKSTIIEVDRKIKDFESQIIRQLESINEEVSVNNDLVHDRVSTLNDNIMSWYINTEEYDLMTTNSLFEVKRQLIEYNELIEEIHKSQENLEKMIKKEKYKPSVKSEEKDPDRIEEIFDPGNNAKLIDRYLGNKKVKSELYVNDILKYVQHFEDGMVISSRTYDESGKLTIEVYFYDNGAVKERIEYLIGDSKVISRFDEDGELIA